MGSFLRYIENMDLPETLRPPSGRAAFQQAKQGMKQLLITIPETADEHAIHHAIANRIGVGGGNEFRLHVTIEHLNSTHHSNYTVIHEDRISDGESWRRFAVLKFKDRPFQPIARHPKWTDEDFEEQSEIHKEDEERAILQACQNAGFGISAEGSGGPGQPYSDRPSISLYENSIIVSQHGGIDC